MSSLFPPDFYSGVIVANAKNTITPTLLKDYLIDFETGQLAVSDSGQFTVVTGLEAVVVQMWRKLHTPKNTYLIYSSKYGNTFLDLIGKSKSYADAYAYTKLSEAIIDDVYVKKISSYSTSLNDTEYVINFTVNTIYGDTNQVLTVDLEGLKQNI